MNRNQARQVPRMQRTLPGLIAALALSFLGMTDEAIAQVPTEPSVGISNAHPGGGTPVSATFDTQWVLGNGHTEVELTFKLVRGDQVISTSETFTYQQNGSDTFDVQFEESVQVGDKIRVEARFTGGGPPDPEFKEDVTDVEDEE